MSELNVLDNNKLVPVEGKDLQVGQQYFLLTEREEDKPLSSLQFYQPETALKTGDNERLENELIGQDYLVGRVVIVENDAENGVVRLRNPQTTLEQGLLYGDNGWKYEDVNNPGQAVELPNYDDNDGLPAIARNPGHSQLNHADGLTQEESARRGSHTDTTSRDFSKVDGNTTKDDRYGKGNEVIDHGDGSSTLPENNQQADITPNEADANTGVNPDGSTKEPTTDPVTDPRPTESQPGEVNPANPDNNPSDNPEKEEEKSNDPASSDNNGTAKDVQPVVGGGSQFSQSGNNTKGE